MHIDNLHPSQRICLPTSPVARISNALLNPGETIDFNGGKVTYPDIKLMSWAGGKVEKYTGTIPEVTAFHPPVGA